MHNTTAVVIMLNLFEDMKSNCDGKYFKTTAVQYWRINKMYKDI